MSFIKVLITVGITGLILFLLMMVFTLTPTIRNVSNQASLHSFLNKPLRLHRPAYIYFMEDGQYELNRNMLSEALNVAGERKYELASGTSIRIREFKTYKSAVAGFTHLYAIGTFESSSGESIEFAYDWAGVDQGTQLPYAIWQKQTEKQISFEQ